MSRTSNQPCILHHRQCILERANPLPYSGPLAELGRTHDTSTSISGPQYLQDPCIRV